jgi:hypothetical protein
VTVVLDDIKNPVLLVLQGISWGFLPLGVFVLTKLVRTSNGLG